MRFNRTMARSVVVDRPRWSRSDGVQAWRRRAESNRRIGVLQTPALTTWLRRLAVGHYLVADCKLRALLGPSAHSLPTVTSNRGSDGLAQTILLRAPDSAGDTLCGVDVGSRHDVGVDVVGRLRRGVAKSFLHDADRYPGIQG